MQAKSSSSHIMIIPQKFLAPVKLVPAQTNHPPPLLKNIPRAISTTTSSHEVISDDKVIALRDYQFLFVSQRLETPEPITLPLVDGAIPADFPSGAYYLTGPGVLTDDHGSTVHPLDGHGYLRMFRIDGAKGQVEYMAKYVKTEALMEERDPVSRAWRFTYRGPFSVLKGEKMVGNVKVIKNVANTSVLRWGGRVFCLWEGGNPYEIHPRTLDTLGEFQIPKSSTLDKDFKSKVGLLEVAAHILRPILYGVFKMQAKRFLSHYKIDAKRNRLLIMSCNAEDMLLPRSIFTFFEFDSDFKLLKSQEFNIPDHLLIHDWAFTDTHYIVFGNRIKLDISGLMTAVRGLSPVISALPVNASKPTSPIYLLPREAPHESKPQRDWRIPFEASPQLWVMHVANAHEYRDDYGNCEIQIQATGCSYSWFNYQNLFGYDWKTGKLDPTLMNVKAGQEKLLPHLIQVSINLDSKGKCEKCSIEDSNQWGKPADFPVINQDFSGCKNAYVYAATSSGSRPELPHFPFDTVVKFNIADKTIQSWSTASRRFTGEPIFVPRGSEEDDGYLLVVEYAVSTEKCYLVILDAKQIGKSNALVARAEVPRHLNFPFGFHGFWAHGDQN